MTARPARVAVSAPDLLRVVRGRRFARPQLGMWGVYTLIAVLAFFALIYSRTALDETAFELQELNAQIAVQLELRQQLGLEAARLASPSEIVPAAEAMGLVLPDTVIPVAADGVLIQDDIDRTPAVAGEFDDVRAAP